VNDDRGVVDAPKRNSPNERPCGSARKTDLVSTRMPNGTPGFAGSLEATKICFSSKLPFRANGNGEHQLALSPGFNVFALTFATVQPQLGFGFCNCSTASRCSDT